MKGYLQHQFSAFKDALRAGAPNTNPAGMLQTVFENRNDVLWDDALGPALRIGGKIAILGGIGAAAHALSTNPDSGFLGGVGGATIAGAGLGALALSAVGQAKAREIVGDGFLTGLQKFGYRFGLPAAGAAIGAAGGAAYGALGGWAGVGLAAGAIAGGIFLNSRGIDPSLPVRGALRALGGNANILGGVIHGTRAVAGGLWTAARGVELGARAILTGGRGGMSRNALDAWFPFFRNTPIKQHTTDFVDDFYRDKLVARGVPLAKATEQATIKAGTKVVDPRKFAPNPRIIRRMAGMGTLFALGQAVHEGMQPQIAPPTLFFDGRNMRHVNDLGTGGGYGMGVMGRNSSLNMNAQDAARIITNAF